MIATTEYLAKFVLPRVRTTMPSSFYSYISAAISTSSEAEQRYLLETTLKNIKQHTHENNQWIDDDEPYSQLEESILNALLPLEKLPSNHPKLYYDLMNLNHILETTTTQKTPYSPALEQYVYDIQKCIPHSATNYCSLIRMQHMHAHYTRLVQVRNKLATTIFDDRREMITTLVMAIDEMAKPGLQEPVIISTNCETFMQQWKDKVFDGRHPATVYPHQKMYRNEGYSNMDLDSWLMTHRSQLQFMDGAEFWHKSPGYNQLSATVHFAFHNYPQFQEKEKEQEKELPSYRLPQMHTMHRSWDLSSHPVQPIQMVFPDEEFESYYTEIVDNFCNVAEDTYRRRTAEHIHHLYTQASKIRVMTEIAMNINKQYHEIKIDQFILLATLDIPIPGLDSYRNRIDEIAYKLCSSNTQF